MCGESGDAVEPGVVRTPVVVRDGSSKMKSVGQRCARNLRCPRVDGIDAHSQVGSAVETRQFWLELRRQSFVDPRALAPVLFLVLDFFACFLQQPRAFHPGPGTDAEISRLYQS